MHESMFIKDEIMNIIGGGREKYGRNLFFIIFLDIVDNGNFFYEKNAPTDDAGWGRTNRDYSLICFAAYR